MFWVFKGDIPGRYDSVRIFRAPITLYVTGSPGVTTAAARLPNGWLQGTSDRTTRIGKDWNVHFDGRSFTL